MKDKLKTLIRFEVVDYGTTYAVVSLTHEEYEFFSQCHNQVGGSDQINTDQQSASDTINVALAKRDESRKYPSKSEDKYAGLWLSNVVDLTDINDNAPFDRYIETFVFV